MQISDLVLKYNRNQTSGTDELNSARSTEKMASTVHDLEPGSVFEGTVNQVKNGRVTLALGNGQTIDARLDNGVKLITGRSMFFLVKSNDGETIALKPYTGAGANGGNPVLLNALDSAQVPVNQRNLAMVDAMMQEQMPIGRQNILDMVRVINANQNIDVATLVQLTKAGIPISETTAAQFESYMDGNYAMTDELNETSQALIDIMSDENITTEQKFELFSAFTEVFVSSEEQILGSDGTIAKETAQAPEGSVIQGETEGSAVQNETESSVVQSETEGSVAQNMTDVAKEAAQAPEGSVIQGETEGSAVQNETEGSVVQSETESSVTHVMADVVEEAAQTSGKNTLIELLGDEGVAQLERSLTQVPALAGDLSLFGQENADEVYVNTFSDETFHPENAAQLDKNMTVNDFVRTVEKALSDNRQYGFVGIEKLLSSREMKTVLHDVMDKQWTIKPDELKNSDRINALYEKIDRQLTQMDAAVRSVLAEQNAFSQNTVQVQGNIDFMNQINQLYTYVQIPLQLSGQNANGELYVYTNGKKHIDPDSDITAFLHLDMDNLGSTDVSVRMHGKQVKTNFYLSDDESYDLVEKNLPVLEYRLKEKGYNCTLSMSRDQKPKTFAEQVIGADKDARDRGIVRRYSFDVRA